MHWFMDKLNMTGSIYQLINGIILISTFFFCRLVWGSVNSVLVFKDIWIAMQNGGVVGLDQNLGLKYGLDQPTAAVTPQDQPFFGSEDIMRYAGARTLPAWLALSYLASNIVLNVLNWYWFAKMIEALRKRFDPPFGTKRPEKKEKAVAVEEKTTEPEIEIQRGLYDDGRKTIEITALRVLLQPSDPDVEVRSAQSESPGCLVTTALWSYQYCTKSPMLWILVIFKS